MKTFALFVTLFIGSAISVSFNRISYFGSLLTTNVNEVSSSTSLEVREEKFNNHIESIHNCLDDSSINLEAFQYGMKGYQALRNLGKLNEKDQFILVDFTKPSTEERFYLIDLETECVVYKKHVAHGRNSGDLYAEDFSNIEESRQSSLGFYVTAETYNGKYDNSLIIEGQEWSNDQARKRGVVIHSADYATKEFIQENGRLGRSYGCPALPHEDYEEIIDLIKDGTCLFIYYNDDSYLKKSKFLKKELYLQSFH